MAATPGLIELRLQSLDQLFDPFDPFPIPTRDLARSAEEFVVGWARELPAGVDLSIRIYLPAGSAGLREEALLQSAIASHFQYRARRTESDMRELFTIAQISLAIGLAALGVCMAIRHMVLQAAGSGPIAGFFAEGLVIVGWVANWRPIELFLYEWWPLARRRRLFERLAGAPVTLVAATSEA